MEFFYKFLKVFNSAAKPWQVTLAIVLAMISGFVPLEGVQGFVILLIILVINIPIAIYLFFTANFALIGYLLDPVFETVGYALLTMDALEGVWTSLYNIGFFRLFHFDNTIVTGSWVVSLLLALPLYFIVKLLLSLYRERIAAFFDKLPLLNKLGLFKISDKKVGALRIWGVAVFAVVSGLIIAFIFLFMDMLFKAGLQKGLSAALNKEVVIKELEVKLDEGALSIKGLEVLNSDQKSAALYIDNIHADMDFNALLMGKKHIESIKIAGMTFDEAVVNALAQEEVEAETADSEEKTDQMTAQSQEETPKSVELPDVDELLKKEPLKSSELADKSKAEYEAIRKKWEDVINNEFSKTFRESFKKDLDLIKAQAKDIKKIKDTKKRVDAFKAKVRRTKQRINELKKEFKADQKLLKERIDAIKKAKTEDYKRLKGKYSLDKGGAINVVGALFGEKIKGHLETADTYYAQVSPYLKSDENATEVTPQARHEGRWIRFKEELPSPRLLVKKVDIDGNYHKQEFSAKVTDITDDQKLLGKTTKMVINSDGKMIQKLTVRAEENRLGKEAVTTLEYRAKRLPDVAFDFGFISLKKSDVGFEGHAKVQAEKLTGKTDLDFVKAELTTKNISGKIAKGLKEDLKRTKKFAVAIKLSGKVKEPNISVKSDLEKVVADSLRRMMRAELKRFEDQLNRELGKLVGEDIKAIDLGKLAGIEKSLGKEDRQLNQAQSKAEAEAKKALKLDSKKLQKFLKF